MLRAPICSTSAYSATSVDVFGGDDFGDDREAGFVAGRGEQFQAFFLQALEAVGAGARLERAAAEGRGAGLLDRAGRCDDLLFAFDGAGAGDDAEVPAADGEAAGADDRRLGLRFEAGELVGGEDGQHFVDAGAAFEDADAARSRSSPMAAMTVRSVPRSTVGFRPSDSTCLIMCSMSCSLASRRMTTIMGRLLRGLRVGG